MIDDSLMVVYICIYNAEEGRQKAHLVLDVNSLWWNAGFERGDIMFVSTGCLDIRRAVE